MLKILNERQVEDNKKSQNAAASNQHGTGMRGDKRRTYRFQDDTVKDHVTGKSAKASTVLAGCFDLLW